VSAALTDVFAHGEGIDTAGRRSAVTASEVPLRLVRMAPAGRAGGSVLVATHDQTLLGLADRVLDLGDGVITEAAAAVP
jgi:ABC-type ATPase involved in cell division